MIIRTALALALAFFAATATSADHHMTGMQSGAAVTVTEAWARASIGKNGAAFLTVTNRGKTGDTLVGVTADVARRVELHTHKMDGNIMRMRQIQNVPIAAGATVMLKPGGHHVMLMGLTRKLAEGESFPLTLVFEKAGKMQVSVKIGKIGAAGPMGGMKPMGGHGGHKMKQ